MMLNLNDLILFGLFLGIILVFISVITVGINKIMIVYSSDNETRNKNALLIQLGSILGSLSPIFIFLVVVNSSLNWDPFFLMGIIFSIPILLFGFILKDNNSDSRNIIKKDDKLRFEKKSIILMSFFLFFAFSDKMFSYSIKPWISIKTNTIIFSILWFIFILLYTLGNILGGIFLKKIDCKFILIISTLILGLELVIAPFINFFYFLISFGFYHLISGLFLVKLIPLMMEISQNKVFYYQLMATFTILANVIFTPIGTYLYSIISTELIIMLAGIIILASIIPITFVKI